VLEIGGGSGAMADGAARLFPRAHLTVTDIDPDMVAVTRRRVAAHDNVVVEQADVTDLTFGDESFDVVTSYLMLHHVIGWREALAEAARVLRPGGVLVGYDLTDTRFARLIHRVDGSPHALVSTSGLGQGLVEAGLVVDTLRVAARGQLVRFAAHKPA
jgi:ubiquinone/menaquinone biosynthesis C-methylase UbiE